MKVLFVGYATADIIENEFFPGGAAGVMALNAAYLGVDSYLLTVLGIDLYGVLYQDLLKKHRVNTSLCKTDAPAIPICIIEDPYAPGSQRKWNDSGVNKYIKNLTLSKKGAAQFDGVFIVNSHPTLAENVAKHDFPYMFYIPGPQAVLKKDYIRESVLKKATVVIGNQEEQKSIFNNKPFDLGTEMIVITKGKNGGTIYRNKKKEINFEAPFIKETIDPTGAGDNFALGFGLKMIEKADLQESIELGKQLTKASLSKKGGYILDLI